MPPQHRSDAEEPETKENPIISIDFAFRARNVEEEMAWDYPVLVVHESSSEDIRAMALDKKGAAEWITKWLKGWVEEIGLARKRIIAKGDSEATIRAMFDDLGRAMPDTTFIPGDAVKYESKSNGTIEEAVQTKPKLN